jgi:two-component system chemotaxis response regulator CheB
MNKCKVLIVDDSPLIQHILSEMLSSDAEIEIVGTAIDPYEAREKIKALSPDVITLDIEMPNMNGIAFLEKIMQLRPMPVIMVSTHTHNGAEYAIKALEMGAVDCIGKPLNINDKAAFAAIKDELISKVKCAAKAKVHSRQATISQVVVPFTPTPASKGKLIAIGSSTGGIEALKHVFTTMPKAAPPVVIVQHILPQFTISFAASLNSICQMKVAVAENSVKLEQGHVYIAPGNFHLTIEKKGEHFYSKLNDEAKMSGHKPSVDSLFFSVAKYAGKSAIGVMLTGMGQDGASGMLEMKKNGAYNIGQNEESCVVYGMPKAAKLKGAIDVEVALKDISVTILKHCV